MLDFLAKCQQAYTDGSPLITDDEFDYLADKYNYFEVGYPIDSDIKVDHLYQMFSLKKVFDDDEANPKRLFKDPIQTSKLDGAAIELVYRDGFLISAATRGDGLVGDDILLNIVELQYLPRKINNPELLQITGEIVAPKHIENARNYAAGALHLKDPVEFSKRDLRFIAYGLKGLVKVSYIDDMSLLADWGFSTVLQSAWDDYPQDGVVFRENDNALFNSLGYT
ncbi:MAG: hypothetical protein DRN17_05035, partial [Thermoplasmata archaeon]